MYRRFPTGSREMLRLHFYFTVGGGSLQRAESALSYEALLRRDTWSDPSLGGTRLSRPVHPEGPACQVRRATLDYPFHLRGHDERAPPNGHDNACPSESLVALPVNPAQTQRLVDADKSLAFNS